MCESHHALLSLFSKDKHCQVRVAARCVTEVFSTTCAVDIGDNLWGRLAVVAQWQKLCSSKTNGRVTTSLESAVFLLSSNACLNFIARFVLELQLLKVPSSRSCSSRSGFSSLLLPSYDSPPLQIHRNSRIPSQLSTNRVRYFCRF